ncbi:MAG: hypothetical protein HQ517_06095 [SAR324 cluster bacterium]|nr:hypothetical protein [SAR324 cluster bacterium]
MSEKKAADNTDPDPGNSSKSQGKEQPASEAEAKLLEDINRSLSLPLPTKDEFWVIDTRVISQKKKKNVLGLFKKKELSEDELSKLRQAAEYAPGTAMVKIQMLNKKYASNNALTMLSAYCTYRLVMNSSDRKGVLDSLKSATKEAAHALINNGINLCSLENFFSIYFEYLTKIKRFQISTYKSLRGGVNYLASKNKMVIAINLCDSLLDEKERASQVLSQIKVKFKSSCYSLPWEFNHIQMAGKKVEQKEYKAICGPMEARELMVFSLALTEIFARIPILSPLVESILKLIPESTVSLMLRKSNILVIRAFTQLNIAIQEADVDRMRTIGRQIFKTSCDNINRIGNNPIKQSFEANPYFYLSRIAILTFGIYEAKEQKEIMAKSIKAMLL